MGATAADGTSPYPLKQAQHYSTFQKLGHLNHAMESSMSTIDQIPTPALLLDLDRLDANLKWMADRATELGVALRPHIKTHKCIEIGKRQLDLGATWVPP